MAVHPTAVVDDKLKGGLASWIPTDGAIAIDRAGEFVGCMRACYLGRRRQERLAIISIGAARFAEWAKFPRLRRMLFCYLRLLTPTPSRAGADYHMLSTLKHGHSARACAS